MLRKENYNRNNPVSTFTGLSDTPSTYSGQAGKVVAVNGTADGLIFTTGGGAAVWGGITGTLSNQTDLQTALNNKANVSHTHTTSQVTDFDAEVSNNTDVAANTAARHARQHAINSTSDHTGVPSAVENNFMSFNANGLPKDSGYDASDFATASGYVPYVGATTSVNIGTNTYIGHALRADATDGILFESANGTDVAIFGPANTTNSIFYGNVSLDSENKVINMADPTDGQDAVTLSYLENYSIPLGSVGTNHIAYGSGGSISGEAAFTYNPSTRQLTLTGSTSTSAVLRLASGNTLSAHTSAADLQFFDGATMGFRFLAAFGNSPASTRYGGFIAYSDRDGTRLPIKFLATNAGGTQYQAFSIEAGSSLGTITYGAVDLASTVNQYVNSLSVSYPSVYSSYGTHSGVNTTFYQDFSGVNSGGGWNSSVLFRTMLNGSFQNVLYLNGASPRVGIGNTAPTGKLHITGTSDEVQHRITMNSIQNSYAFLVETSGGSIRAGIEGSGQMFCRGANLGYNAAAIGPNSQGKLSQLWIPRDADITNFIFGDYMDEAYYWDKRYDSITFSTNPNFGAASTMFRDDSTNCEWISGTSIFPLTIEIDSTTNPIAVKFNAYYQVGMTFRSSGVAITNIKVEYWDGSAYATGYDGPPYDGTSSGYSGGFGYVLTNKFLTNPATGYDIRKLKITLSGSNPIGASFRIQRLMVYHDTAVWDPWHLNTGGGSVYGNVGIGTYNIGAKLHVVEATEQLRVGYDASNYLSVTVASNGATTLNATGAGAGLTISDSVNITSSLQCDSIVNDTGLAQGTYTPTLTNTTNVAASTAYLCQYTRVGNMVTVSGRVDIDPTTAGISTVLGFTLPVASNFVNAFELGGSASSPSANQSYAIFGDTTNDRATFQGFPASASNLSHYFTFSYLVK